MKRIIYFCEIKLFDFTAATESLGVCIALVLIYTLCILNATCYKVNAKSCRHMYQKVQGAADIYIQSNNAAILNQGTEISNTLDTHGWCLSTKENCTSDPFIAQPCIFYANVLRYLLSIIPHTYLPL